MQIRTLVTVTGYNEEKVKTAVTKIRKKISDTRSKLDVSLDDEPVKKNNLLKNQPPLHGCDHKDITIFALPISGSLEDIKRLADTETPDGVMVEILPSVA